MTVKQQEAQVGNSGVIIVPAISEDLARVIIDRADEYSPLRSVAFHVAQRQIARALALHPESDGGMVTREAAERELVRLYVREDFCGLCGRYTDHRGEH